MQKPLSEILSSGYTKELTVYFKNNRCRLPELRAVALENNRPDSPRAAWMWTKFVKPQDTEVLVCLDAILLRLGDATDGHQRDLLRILYIADNYKEQAGLVFDKALAIWEDRSKLPATRYMAYQVLLQIGEWYPELQQEIDLLSTDFYLETLSPGIQHSLRKKLKKSTR
ncbi:MAG: hypothetical protein OIF50_12665 [Flavobacteriaceae bacterium]|nr:hypothetical protein [Flavobacteriaceae bacterium]